MENRAKLEHGKTILEDRVNIPKCPTCNSTNIKRISISTKVVNTALFGLLETKRHKMFKYENCESEW